MGKTKKKPTEKIILRRSKDPYTHEEVITAIFPETPIYRWNPFFSYYDVYLPIPTERKGDWVRGMFSMFGSGRVSCEGECDMACIHRTTKPVRPNERDAKDVLKVLKAIDNAVDYKVVMKVPKRLNYVD